MLGRTQRLRVCSYLGWRRGHGHRHGVTLQQAQQRERDLLHNTQGLLEVQVLGVIIGHAGSGNAKGGRDGWGLLVLSHGTSGVQCRAQSS